MKSSLGIVTMLRNEGPYLVEWIEYHRLVGVSRFWLYDNGSTDDGLRRLQPYIAKGVVELTPWPTVDNPPRRRERIIRQLNAAKDGFRKARGKVEWVTHLDVDEFLLPMQEHDVPSCLKKHFSEASGVYVNWRMFGTSGVTVPLGDPLLSKLTSCAVRDHSENSVGKSLVRPEAVNIDAIWYVHHFPLLSGFYVDGGKNRLSFNVRNDLVKNDQHFDAYLRINHYNLRDEHFYQTRRRPDAVEGRLVKKLDRLTEHHEAFSKDRDTTIVKYLKREHPAAYCERWKR
jgi:hypothetical protein